MECFRLLLDNLAWIEHEFLSSIRDSRKAGSLWGMMRGVWVVRKSVHQSWLAKGLGLGLLCWGFKFMKIFRQKRPALFKSGVWHFHDGNTQTIWPRWASRQFLTLPIVQTLLPVTFAYSLSSEASLWENWGDERGCDEGDWHAHTRGLRWGLPEVVGTVQQVHCSRGDYFEGDLSFMSVLSIKVPIRKKVWKLI